MDYILFVGAVLTIVASGYFILTLADLLLEKYLRYVAKRMYRKQTQEAITSVMAKKA